MKSESIFFLVSFISLQIPYALRVRAKDPFALNSGKEGLHIFADYNFYLPGENHRIYWVQILTVLVMIYKLCELKYY